ncbi:MAG: DMT family transporter [Rhodobacteraceae bacterium]|nr:DMT family transporter [Paracoccaceae bacterium]
MSRKRATLTGFFAVLFWSALALLTVAAAPVPPFQLNAMAFLVGGIIGLGWIGARGGLAGSLGGIGWPAWLLGVGGLFGYHFLYFSALRLAPAAEAGLIAYLWPLLIVLFSGLLPGEKLRAMHVAGALISLSGAGLILWGGGAGFDPGYAPGYLLAAIGALTWASYSVLSRRVGHIPTTSVAWFCLAASGLSLLAHLAFEVTTWPEGAIGWAAVLGLGLGPVGLAFYLWDIGVKQGDIQLLGVASYAAPLLSTLILIAFGITAPTQSLLLAAVLITAGAALAARASRRNI